LKKALCISHSDDVDGVASAALIRRACGAELLLLDYDQLLDGLRGVRGIGHLYLCDLGTSRATFPRLKEELERLRGEGAKVTYIDHHTLTTRQKRELIALGVELIHTVKECTSVLVYNHFKDRLPEEAALLPCYGAITDLMDDRPLAFALIERFDRTFLRFEAALLMLALKRYQDPGYATRLAGLLAELKMPHEIEGIVEAAVAQAGEVARLMERVKREGQRVDGFAHIRIKEGYTGIAATLVRGLFDVEVGVALSLRGKYARVSLRGGRRTRHHLGRIANRLATELGGFGGGHRRAAGLQVSADRVEEFLERLRTELA
jgi:RecJ-like exonuclease